ncbi:ABC transporter ATP-binding protein [Advenella sp. EE-W14]|uniref:ABC transporter ATP-binding protein n=1 Tax=Advenella sp. EE-W14 TaxID=2722705 RepID=UPI00353010A3
METKNNGAATAAEQAVSALEAKNLSAGYDDHNVFENMNLELRKNEILCLIGHNGAGKSTLLKVLFGLQPYSAGEVLLNGQHIVPSPSDMAGHGISYVPEGRGVFPGLTVKENFALALWSAKMTGQVADERVEEVLSVLPKLKDFWTRKAGQLSGGQQQMVSIGRAMLCKPSILLLDEPSIGLAPKLFQDLLEPIRAVQKQRGMSILLVEQQVGEALNVSDRVVVMKSGEIIYRGVPADFEGDHAKLMEMF